MQKLAPTLLGSNRHLVLSFRNFLPSGTHYTNIKNSRCVHTLFCPLKGRFSDCNVIKAYVKMSIFSIKHYETSIVIKYQSYLFRRCLLIDVWSGHLSNLVTMKLKETTQVLLAGYQIDEEKTFSSMLCFDQMYDL